MAADARLARQLHALARSPRNLRLILATLVLLLTVSTLSSGPRAHVEPVDEAEEEPQGTPWTRLAYVNGAAQFRRCPKVNEPVPSVRGLPHTVPIVTRAGRTFGGGGPCAPGGALAGRDRLGPESPPADAVIASAATLSPSPAMSLSPDPGPPPVESVAPAPAVEVTEKATAPPPSPFAIEVPSPNFLSLQHNPPTTDAPFASIVAPEARPQPQASLALDHPPVAPAAHLVPQPSALQEVHHYAQPPLLSVPENAAPAMLPTHIAAHLAPPSTADVLQAQAQAAAQAAAAHAGAQAKAAAVAAAAAQDAAAVEARRFDDQMRQKREVRASVVIPARIPNAFVEWVLIANMDN